MNNTIIPQHEIDSYKVQLASAERYSTTLEVRDDASYQGALAEAKKIKAYFDGITARKEEMTKPLNTTLKSIRALFAPFESAAETALQTVKTKMLAYTTDQEAKVAKKIAKIDEKVENGTMGEGVASAKKFMLTPEKTIATENGSATTKKVKKYYVINKALIPLQFMEPDMVKIKASFKAGTPVEGIEERLENELAIR